MNRGAGSLSLPLYPFAAAAYPVLALAAANQGELVRPGHLVRPLAVALGVAAVLWLLARLATVEVHRRAIVTFVAVVVFSSYGYWQAVLLDLPPLDRLAADAVAFPLAVAMVLGTGWSARSGGRTHPGVTRYLNVVLALLVGSALVALAFRAPGGAVAVEAPNDPLPARNASALSTNRPHLFVIVPDKYTGSRSLAAHYRYDNGAFERELESRGFVVARNARANYVQTFLALATMLNWDYVDRIAGRIDAEEERRELLYPSIEDNRTRRLLQAAGYRFVFLPTGYAPTAANRFADVQLAAPGATAREFEAAWLRTTMLYPMLTGWCRECTGGLVWNVHESAASIAWRFEQLERLAESDRPLFVLAHLPVPHEPYVFAADCAARRPYWPLRDDGPHTERVKGAYVAQIACLNRKLLHLFDAIQQRSRRPAVIVLQSDHGHGRFGLNPPAVERMPAAQLVERLDVLAAYHLPGAPAALVHDSIGPVNAMRAVMRHYFGADLPPLEEASYWSDAAHPYRFTRVR
jgi:hypothetical protein